MSGVIDRATEEVFSAMVGYDGDFDNDGTGEAEVKEDIRAILARHFGTSTIPADDAREGSRHEADHRAGRVLDDRVCDMLGCPMAHPGEQ